MDSSRCNRRQFLGTAALGASASAGLASAAASPVAIVLDPADPVAAAPPCRWAAGELSGALIARGIEARIVDRIAQAAGGDLCIVATGNRQGRAPSVPEGLALGSAKVNGRDVVFATGQDPRGLVYALLELADRVRNSRRRCRRSRRARTHCGAPREHDPQRHPPLHQRHRRQALVQRPRNVAALPHDARHPALQPLQPEFRHRLRLSPQRDRRLLSLRLSVPARRSRLQRARAAAARCRARSQSRNAAVHQRADRGPRPGVPARHLDARLRVDQQPATPTTPSRASPRRTTARTAAMRCARC